MEIMVSQEWLRRRIENDPDVETDAGTPIDVMEDIGMFLPPELVEEDASTVRLKHSFGVLVRQLRRRDRLSLEQLAVKARVDVKDLRAVEQDPHFHPRPRIVHQLSEVFRLPEKAMMKISGATVNRNEKIEEEALRFAAKSDDLSKLSRAEEQALNEFVKFLSTEAD